jgi:peptidoglycan/LPS O-acetylase OafA/YrhL
MIGAYHECGDTESYLGFLSTFGYWYVGNYNGMWYVAVIVLLYLMYPLVNRTTDAIATFITKRNNHKYASINGGLIINVLAITAIYFIISRMTKLFPEYLMNNGISLAPFFFTGSLFAHMAYKEESVKYSTILILCMISIIIGPANFRTLFAILFSCYMFELFKIKDTKILALLRWFGKYTFELYIVHLNLYFFCSSMDLLPLKNGVANTLLVYLVAIPIAVAVHNVSKRIKDCILKNFKVVAK